MRVETRSAPFRDVVDRPFARRAGAVSESRTYHFDMWVGDYLGAQARAALTDWHLVGCPVPEVTDEGLTLVLVEPEITRFLERVESGALNLELRQVLVLPVVARHWTGRYQAPGVADAPLRLVISFPSLP